MIVNFQIMKKGDIMCSNCQEKVIIYNITYDVTYKDYTYDIICDIQVCIKGQKKCTLLKMNMISHTNFI
jgi:hypothetical protein